MVAKFKQLWHFLRRPKIEFAEWETPFKNGCLAIISVQYQSEPPYFEGREFNLAKGPAELSVRLFHLEERRVYALLFKQCHAFRVLDEGGLMEIWRADSEQNGRPATSTFRVRNHGWFWESVTSFVTGTKDNWAFLIASDWECVEILSRDEPIINLERTISEHPLH